MLAAAALLLLSLAPSTSATAGALPSGQVFNVYSYGAVGDGVANDTAAIQR
jgi:polygalacturonase